jgi:predicted nucleic acid-binding Zn ribbon protein
MKPLGIALKEFTTSLGIGKKLEQYEAVTRWEEIVGPRIAKETEPVKIEQGVLIVKVRTSVWRNELSMRKQEIKERINKAIGHEVLSDIKFQ